VCVHSISRANKPQTTCATACLSSACEGGPQQAARSDAAWYVYQGAVARNSAPGGGHVDRHLFVFICNYTIAVCPAFVDDHGPGSGCTVSHLAPRADPKRRFSTISSLSLFNTSAQYPCHCTSRHTHTHTQRTEQDIRHL